MSEYTYFEGQFVPLEDAKISIKTHAFLYGTSLFEGVRGYYLPESNAIAIFCMREHYERLIRNAHIFHMDPFHDLGLSLDKLMDVTVELIRKNAPRTDTYIRPTLYKTGTNIGPNLEATKTEFCLWTNPLGNYVDITKGLSVCVSSWRRLSDNSIPPRAKAGGAYMNTALAVTDAKKMGFDEAIFLTEQGHVSEGSAMNLFLIRDGKLITPGVNQNILEGITRHCIMRLAKEELGMDTEERVIDRTELYHADEAFYCGTGAQVSPITKIDLRAIGDGQVGKLTKQLQELYFDVVRNKVPKYQDWITLVTL
ncbi:MAG: branched-chain amino acid transaminase [Candidatus Melainabacteria bacterium]